MKLLLALLFLPLTALGATTLGPGTYTVASCPSTPPVTTPPVTTPPVTGPAGAAPVITAVTALPMGWKVSFAPVAGAVNYLVTDPNQHWLSSGAGSAHVSPSSPIFVQGGSGAASLMVYAQSAKGWSAGSTAWPSVKVLGALPAYTDPYWIYANGTYNWSGDFSQPGGDPATLLPQFGGSGGQPNPNTVAINWFYTGDASFPAGAVQIINPVAGNFSPAIPGATIDLGAHPYAFWVATVKPTYANADYNLKFESMNDEVVTNILPSLKQYVTAPTPGAFTQNAVNTLNVPMSALALHANKTDGKTSIYKIVWQQNFGTAGTWLVGQVGFANTPQ